MRDMRRNTDPGEDLDRVDKGANAGRVEGLEVEHLDALDGTEDLKTLETSGLVLVGGDLTRLRTLTVDLGGGGVGAARRGGRDGTHSGRTGRPEGGASGEGSGAEGGGEHGFWRESTARCKCRNRVRLPDDACVTTPVTRNAESHN